MGLSETGDPSPWATRRSTRALAAFRIAAAALLAAHFLRMVPAVPALVAHHGLWDIERAHAVVPGRGLSVWLSGLGVLELQLLLGACAALCVLMALGRCVRIAAALLLAAAIALSGALAPLTNLDDPLAGSTLVWLLLLPRDGGRASLALPLFAGSAIALHLCLPLFRLHVPSWEAGSWLEIALAATPAFFVAPGTAPRALGTALALYVHARLVASTGLVLTHGVMAASLILLWGERRRVAASPALSAGAVIASVWLLLLALSPASPGARRVLFDAGLLPRAVGERPRERWQQLQARSEDGVRLAAAPALPLADPRVQALLAYLDAPNAVAPAFKDDLARRLASRYCRAPASRGRHAVLTLASASAQRRKVAWFTCAEPGAPAEILRLQADASASDVASNGEPPSGALTHDPNHRRPI